MEVIEFPSQLFHIDHREVIDEFHEYCRPVINPKLTDFCTELTGITQETNVLRRHNEWLRKHCGTGQ